MGFTRGGGALCLNKVYYSCLPEVETEVQRGIVAPLKVLSSDSCSLEPPYGTFALARVLLPDYNPISQALTMVRALFKELSVYHSSLVGWALQCHLHFTDWETVTQGVCDLPSIAHLITSNHHLSSNPGKRLQNSCS